ncbi:MAG TPA: FAD-dependent oxidoreductase [Terriglobales bacterium]|nr:FAD-dependent oxidoreductase [Terriglobales bacterium]
MSPTETHDLIVIGGGPAGSSAAIMAARGGARVLLLERGRFPRHKVCGEFVSAESLHLLQAFLPDAEKALLEGAAEISAGRFFLDGHTLKTIFVPAARSIARLDLDFALWRAAQQSGVEALQPAAALQVRGHGPFQVATSAAEFSARAVINATGRWSNLNQPATGDEKKWLGLKQHFAEPEALRSVDLYFFEGGYCGVQPVELAGERKCGRINACAMVRADVASSLAEAFMLNPALRERSRSWQPRSEAVSTSPLIFHVPQPVRRNVFLAGDAAAFVDPFIGDGISLALRSGSLAAACLLPFFQGKVSLHEAAGQYQRQYERRLAGVFRASSKIRRALLLPPAARKPLLFFLERTPAVTRFLVSKTR